MSFEDAIKPIADRATMIINGNEDTLALLERIDELEDERTSLEADLESVGLMIVRMDKGKSVIAIQPGGVGVAKLREAFKL